MNEKFSKEKILFAYLNKKFMCKYENEEEKYFERENKNIRKKLKIRKASKFQDEETKKLLK